MLGGGTACPCWWEKPSCDCGTLSDEDGRGREQCEQRLVVTFGEWQKHRKGAWEKSSPAKGQEKQLGLWSGYWGAVKGFGTEEANDHHWQSLLVSASPSADT